MLQCNEPQRKESNNLMSAIVLKTSVLHHRLLQNGSKHEKEINTPTLKTGSSFC